MVTYTDRQKNRLHAFACGGPTRGEVWSAHHQIASLQDPAYYLHVYAHACTRWHAQIFRGDICGPAHGRPTLLFHLMIYSLCFDEGRCGSTCKPNAETVPRFRTCQSLPSTNSGRAFRMAVKKSPCLFSSCMAMERHVELRSLQNNRQD